MGSSIGYIWDRYDDYDDFDDDYLPIVFLKSDHYDPCGHQRIEVVDQWEDTVGSMLLWELRSRKLLSPVIHDRVCFFQFHKKYHERHYTIEELMTEFPRFTEETLTDYYDIFQSHFDIYHTGLPSVRTMCKAFEMLGDVTNSPLRVTILMCCFDDCRYFHLYKFIKLCVFLEDTVGRESSMFQSIRRGIRWMHMCWACSSPQYYISTKGA